MIQVLRPDVRDEWLYTLSDIAHEMGELVSEDDLLQQEKNDHAFPKTVATSWDGGRGLAHYSKTEVVQYRQARLLEVTLQRKGKI